MIPVVTTAEMLAAAVGELSGCDGVIAAAAPCDFEPVERRQGKIPRQGAGLTLRLKPTTDVIATLARRRRPGQWFVAFALEPGADAARACQKITAKRMPQQKLDGLDGRVARCPEDRDLDHGNSLHSGARDVRRR